MSIDNLILRPDQSHAARILLRVSLKVLGARTGLGAETVEDFESGQIELDESQQDQLREGLERLGAEFIPEDDEQGYGVRLRYNAQKITSLNRWEGEGGPTL